MAEEEYEGEYEDEEDEEESQGGSYVYRPNDSLLDALGRQWGAAPWYVSSAAIHLVILVLMLLFAPEPKAPPPPKLAVAGEIEEPVEEKIEIKEPEETPPEETKEEVVVDVSTEVKISEVVVDPTVTVEDTSDTPTDDTSFDANATDSGEVAVMGLNASVKGGGKASGKFGTRSGRGKRDAIRKGGMSKQSQDALEDGLAWLARVQDPAGFWDSVRYEGHCSAVSVTALAQLAFLGAGNSSKVGTYRKNVKASQDWLLARLDDKTGRIGNYRYEAGITLMSMAEAWAMSEDKKLADVVQGQVNDAQKYQNKNGGWGYTTDADAAKAHVDTSVAGWWMMGMKSAKVAGAEVSEQSWTSALSYFKSVTTQPKDGIVTSGYVGVGASPNMTAVGLTCLQFLGLGRDDPLVKGQADFFLNNPQRMINPRYDGANPYYGWYYQALGIFQMGTKSEYWKKFGPVMQTVMCSIQEKSGPDKGSWPPKIPWQGKGGHFEEQVGRVGTTAIGCLILEVCFRYGDAHAMH